MNAPLQAETLVSSGEMAARVIRVRAFPDAMAGPHVDFDVPWGANIADIVAAVPLSPGQEARRRLFSVSINQHKVLRRNWHRVRPAAYAEHRPVMLVVRLALGNPGGGGGGGSRKILTSVAAVALIGASLFVGPLATALGAPKLLAFGLQAATPSGGALLLQEFTP